MGTKGSKLTTDAEAVAAEIVGRLASLGDVTSKKMFGGVGLFQAGTMFGIVDSSGGFFLRAGEANRASFESAGSERHGKMPYFSVPAAVFDDPKEFVTWGATAAAVAHAAKKK